MLITKITFKNFMGYKKLNLPKGNDELPEGLILISGKNSHGKSTILEGILFTFFGSKVFKGRNAASFITYGSQEKAEIFIYFILDKEKYYIYRKWGQTGSITSKLFQFNKIKNVYQEIKQFNVEEFFEISAEQALSTVFVRQGEVEELANKKGAELRDMIIDIFRLNIIDDALSYLDNDSKTKKHEKDKLEKSRVPIKRINEDINHIRKENLQMEKILTEKRNKKQDFEQRIINFPSNELISELENLYNQDEIIQSKFLSYKKDFEAKIKNTDLKIEDFDSQDTINNKIRGLNDDQIQLEKNLDELDGKRQATYKGLGKTKGRIEDIKKNISKMEKSLKFTKKIEGKEIAQCPTCQNELTKEHYDEIIHSFTKDIEINQEKVNSISKIISGFDKEISTLQKKLDIIKKSITIHQALAEDFENHKKYEVELKKVESMIKKFLSKNRNKFLDSSIEGVKKLSVEKEKLSTELKAIITELNEKQEKFEKNKERINQLLDEIHKMEDLAKKIGDYEVDIDHNNKAKEFVRRFVTEYMVVKRLVKNIALTTNKYIKDFTSGQYSDLLLDLSGTKKTGLSLKIRDNYNGEYESTEVLSGGDCTALGIALRLAISELMSSIRPTKESPKRNPKIDFLLLDEPLAALDETRRERILKHLIKSRSFSQIFLITHTAIPQDISAYKIVVEKDISTGISHARFEKPTLII